MNSDLSPQEAKSLVAQQIAERYATAEKSGIVLTPAPMHDLEHLWFELNILAHNAQSAQDDFGRAVAPHRPQVHSRSNHALQSTMPIFHTTSTL